MKKLLVVKILLLLFLPINMFSQQAMPISVFNAAVGVSQNTQNKVYSAISYYSTGIISNSGNKIYSGFWYFLDKKLPVEVRENSSANSEFSVNGNSPNPFSIHTEITFTLFSDGNVSISLYNNLGIKMGEIVNRYFTKGSYSIIFSSKKLPNGVYFYRVNFGSKSIVRKMIIAR